MVPNDQSVTDHTIGRRMALKVGTAAIGLFTGIFGFAGSAGAWQRFDVEFNGCSEAVIFVGKNDLAYEPPLQFDVIVTDGEDPFCQTIDVDHEMASTGSGGHNDDPVFTYEASSDETILGVVARTPAGNPHPFESIANPKPCANAEDLPSVTDAPRYVEPTAIDSPTTIDSPGYYQLVSDFETDPTGPAIEIIADNVVLDGGSSTLSSGMPGIGVTGNDVTLQNLTIGNGDVAIEYDGVKGGKIRNISVSNGVGGILLKHSTGVRVERNRIHSQFGDILLNNSVENVIRHNSANAAVAIGITDSHRNEIMENTGGEFYGIFINRSTANLLRENEIRGVQEGIRLLDAHYNELFGNVVKYCSDGIRLTESEYNILRNNTACSNDREQISIDNTLESSGNEFSDNTLRCGDPR